jgi:hypothetical protein
MKTSSFITLSLAVADAAPAVSSPWDPAEHAKQCAAGVVLDCVVSHSGWATAPAYGFGACSAVCGPGTAKRMRTMLHDQCNGGQACPALQQSEPCMNRVCTCEKV